MRTYYITSRMKGESLTYLVGFITDIAMFTDEKVRALQFLSWKAAATYLNDIAHRPFCHNLNIIE